VDPVPDPLLLRNIQKYVNIVILYVYIRVYACTHAYTDVKIAIDATRKDSDTYSTCHSLWKRELNGGGILYIYNPNKNTY
jgi:hypothetical protein